MRALRVYISGPITGTDDYIERFKKAAVKVQKEMVCEVLNPALLNNIMPESTTHEEYMQMSYAMMNMCDCIFVMPGWENSKGCRLEVEFAIKQHISILFDKRVNV